MGTWVRGSLPMEDLKRLSLTPEEGFVLSRLDARLSTAEVSALTGLPPERAREILQRLAETGAVDGDAPSVVAAESSPETAPEETTDTPERPDEPLDEDTPAEAEDEPAGEADAPVNEAGYRKMYETDFRLMPLGEKLTAARFAAEAELMALALDAEPRVLAVLLENPRFGLQQARFAARWHGSGAGLEALGQKGSFFSDPQFQRMALRNVHLGELLTKRILGGRRMLDAYKISIDTDVPEKARTFARSVLRSKFGTAQGEERAGLICATEGRVLAALSGLTLDGRATSILCARGYTSALFVQSLARFGSCPPPLLAHLLKQPIVKRQLHLKAMLLQHPNMPAEAKRRM